MRNLFDLFDYRLEMLVLNMQFVFDSQVAVRRQRWVLYCVSLDYHHQMDYILLEYWIVEQILPLVEQMDPGNQIEIQMIFNFSLTLTPTHTTFWFVFQQFGRTHTQLFMHTVYRFEVMTKGKKRIV